MKKSAVFVLLICLLFGNSFAKENELFAGMRNERYAFIDHQQGPRAIRRFQTGWCRHPG